MFIGRESFAASVDAAIRAVRTEIQVCIFRICVDYASQPDLRREHAPPPRSNIFATRKMNITIDVTQDELILLNVLLSEFVNDSLDALRCDDVPALRSDAIRARIETATVLRGKLPLLSTDEEDLNHV